eukprot:14001068-Alexandrium_andersonii.AAC.1
MDGARSQRDWKVGTPHGNSRHQLALVADRDGLLPIGADGHGLTPTGAKWCWMVPIGTDWRPLVPTGADWCRLDWCQGVAFRL